MPDLTLSEKGAFYNHPTPTGSHMYNLERGTPDPERVARKEQSRRRIRQSVPAHTKTQQKSTKTRKSAAHAVCL